MLQSDAMLGELQGKSEAGKASRQSCRVGMRGQISTISGDIGRVSGERRKAVFAFCKILAGRRVASTAQIMQLCSYGVPGQVSIISACDIACRKSAQKPGIRVFLRGHHIFVGFKRELCVEFDALHAPMLCCMSLCAESI